MFSTVSTVFHPSPIGLFELIFHNDKLSAINIGKPEDIPTSLADMSEAQQKIALQFDAYFDGKLKIFDAEMVFQKGTDFEQTVWRELCNINYGERISYSDLAFRVGKNEKASRAIGKAVGNNPIAVIIPCHRVVGKSGKLTGFAWGLERKAFLLKLEEEHTEPAQGKLF